MIVLTIHRIHGRVNIAFGADGRLACIDVLHEILEDDVVAKKKNIVGYVI